MSEIKKTSQIRNRFVTRRRARYPPATRANVASSSRESRVEKFDKTIAPNSTGRVATCRMDAIGAARFSWLIESRDVAVLYWPDEADEAERLEREGMPHLLLVDPEATPPTSGSCLAGVADAAGARRRAPDPARRTSPSGPRAIPAPTDGRRVRAADAPRQVALPVAASTICSRSADRDLRDDRDRRRPHRARVARRGDEPGARVHVSRLRQQLRPLGLAIKCAANSGYMMTDASVLVATEHAVHA